MVFRIFFYLKFNGDAWFFLSKTTFKITDCADLGEVLQKALDIQALQPDSREYNKNVAMKAYSFNIRATLRMAQKTEVPKNSAPAMLQRSIRLLEPIKDSSEGIYLFVEAHNLLGSYSLSQEATTSALQFFKVAEKSYNSFKENQKGAQNLYEIFDLPDLKCISWNLETAFLYTTSLIYFCYDRLDSPQMKYQYAIPSIRAKLELDQQETGFRPKETIPQVISELKCLLHKRAFKQLDHLLSGFMYQLVKYRRTLPEEEKLDLNYIQGQLSLLYACWGYDIMNSSFLLIGTEEGTDEHEKLSTSLEICKNFIEFPELIEPGCETYADQFPTNYTKSIQNVKNLFKKVLAWNKRSKELIGNNWEKDIVSKQKQALVQFKEDLDLMSDINDSILA